MLVLKGLVGLHRTVQLQLIQRSWWGIGLDHCGIEWFALETNRDHSVVFETAFEVRGGSREELPHVRGQGKKPGGPHARGAAAKKSYRMSEVRYSGQESQAATVQERPRGVTPARGKGQQLRGAAKRSYPKSEARGGDQAEQLHVQRAVAA